ncbi:MAG: 2-octaprenyl-6-methoxyphenyl hydroxylase [Gammaproteobacteria bacterium]|nr:2-octaprenyl-6-methoxyphenyl hydroxylase [Gammaproteobacteria bacterium]MDH3465885.1 2-octaprenyl-6-methoxyphenyl hydroxylase [Gammaproteobacteria bacterium]
MCEDFDVAIVGGGMVGASLACALTQTRLRSALIDTLPADAASHPSFDERTVALTYSSRLIFEGLGVWNSISPLHAYPILRIHVSDRGHSGITRLDHGLVGTEALGYVVPNRALGKALYDCVATHPGCHKLSPARATAIDVNEDHARLTVESDATNRTIRAKLVVIADGGRSPLTDELGFKNSLTSYPHVALVSRVHTDRTHDGTAYERFAGAGPLALLPIDTKQFALVWTLDEEDAKRLRTAPEVEFIGELQNTFGDRAGIFSNPATRYQYPLALSRLTDPAQPRVVVIGNAAHSVHPVAGQGFNLGLRDVAALADTLYEAQRHGNDIGSMPVLDGYCRWRRRDTRAVGVFTDGLINVFGSRFSPLVTLRNLGLTAIELMPPVKRALLRRTMGLHGPRSRLGLGLRLSD